MRERAGAPAGAGEFHGVEGLGDLEPFQPTGIVGDGPAANAIVDLVMKRPAGSVAIAVLGPMTNLALAMKRERRLADHLGTYLGKTDLVITWGPDGGYGHADHRLVSYFLWTDPAQALDLLHPAFRARPPACNARLRPAPPTMPSAANKDEAKLAIINLSCDELPPKLGPRRGLPGIVNRLLDYLDI